MNTLIPITKIKIILGSRELEFSSDEARKLHAELDALFRVEMPPVSYPVTIPVPIYIHQAPYMPYAVTYCPTCTTTPPYVATDPVAAITITC